MNTIYVTGGKKAERAIATDVVSWCLNKMLPRYRTIEVNVEFEKNLGEAYGYCLQEDKREYTITIKKGLGLFDMISTICHEMVHLKQYVKGELREKDGVQMWKTKSYKNVNYADAPWEKEAFRLEASLAEECFKKLQTIL